MKKILLIIVFFPALGFSQIVKLKTWSTKLAVWKEHDYKTIETTQDKILVVINLNSSKIVTYGQLERDYDIIKTINKDVDPNGISEATFLAIDSDGKKCSIVFASQPDKNAYNLAITKGDVLLVYYMHKDD